MRRHHRHRNASRARGGGRRGHSVCLLDRSLARSRRSQLYPPRAHVRTCTGVRSPAPTLSRCGQRERTSSPSNASRARGAAGRRPPQSVGRSAPTRPGPALLCSSQSTGCLAFAAAHAQARVRVAESTSAAPAIPPCTVPRAAATARGLQPPPGAACRLLLAANVKSRIEHPGCCVGSPLSCRQPATTPDTRQRRCARRQASRCRQHHQRAPHQSPAATRPADPSAEGEPTSQHVGWGLVGPCSALWGLWLEIARFLLIPGHTTFG